MAPSRKKSYTLTNEGYGGNATSTCYKCKQPIEEGQMANWEGGMEAHAGGCPQPSTKPPLTPAQRIQNMPQRGKPKTPAQLGLSPKAPDNGVGYVASRKKKAVGLQNQGQPDAVCPKCQQPIAEGQMVNYPQGRETHVQCPPATGTQPGQGAPGSGYESRLNLPPGFKRPQPKTPGMIPPSVGRPTASLLKKGNRFPDDEWRDILNMNGYHPTPTSGREEEEEIWRNPYCETRVLIGIDEEQDEPFWAEMTEDGHIGEISSDAAELKQLIEPKKDSVKAPEWKNGEPQIGEEDRKFLKDFRIKLESKRIASRRKSAGKPALKSFAFVVPLKAGGTVAFHLAKAGLEDFEVINYDEDDAAMFVFRNEPELHVGEEIVKQEFAKQIEHRKGQWTLWAPQQEDLSALPEPKQEQQRLMSSEEKTADDPNSYMRGKQFNGPQAVPSKYEEALMQALEALETLAEVGPSEDIKGCASMSAGDLRGFAEDAKAGRARHFGSEDESQCCCTLGHLAFSKAAAAERKEEIGELMRGGKTVYYAYVNGVREESEDREAVQKKLNSRHPKQGSFDKQAFDPNLATLVGSWVSLMLVKWLGNEYSKRWGTLAEIATQKASAALQSRGVSDLSTLDKYAQEQGTDRVRAFLSLAGRQLALAAVVTTGIASTKLFNGEAKAQAAQTQSAPQKAPEKAESAKKHHKKTPTEHVTMDVEFPKDETPQSPTAMGVRNVDTKLQSPEDEIGMRDF